MPANADLTGVVYDPPAHGLPHIAVLFDAEGEVIAMCAVESIDHGEAALASLVARLATQEQSAA